MLAGNMAGRTALELTREFGICRRLRPSPQKPVIHHTLSFADGEDPGDGKIGAIAEKYIERMKLEKHQWVAVVHRDKAHVHVHLAVNRIGLDGEWWNATRDYERSQVVAGKIEVEFGLVKVPRERLSYAIQKALQTEAIHPPKVVAPPPVSPPGIKHVLGEMRAILEAIPHGLPAPEWVRTLEASGLVVKPSIGDEKVSGFTVRMPGHRSVKLSDIHRSLSWPKLLSSGRVIYDPDLHFESLSHLRLKEDPYEPSSCATLPAYGDGERIFDPETGEWVWEWEPLQPRVVGLEVGARPGADADPASPGTPSGANDFRPKKAPRPQSPASGEPGTTTSGSPSRKRRVPPSTRIRQHAGRDESVPEVDDIELVPPTSAGPGQHVLGLGAQLGQEPGVGRDRGVDAGTPDAGASRSPGPATPLGELAEPLGGSLPRGSLPPPAGDRRAHPGTSDLGWRGLPGDARHLIGAQADFDDLSLPRSFIPPEIHEAARQAIALESIQRLNKTALQRHAVVRETLWEETLHAELTHEEYRVAKAGLRGIQQHLDLARSIVRELTLSAKQGHALPSPRTEDRPEIHSAPPNLRKKRP